MSWLLVPIHVDALVVTQATAAASQSSPFQDDAVLEAGVHLHWALPDALCTGEVQPGTGAACFPAVPDLWLVLRFSSAPSESPSDGGTDWGGGVAAEKPRTYQAWLIDAYSETVRALPTTPPANAGPDRPWLTAIGKLAQGRLVQQTSAGQVAQNQLFNSAYYPTSRKRFGFHDSLSDVVGGSISYAVVGWYARRTEDPLNRQTEANRESWMQAQGWDLLSSQAETLSTLIDDGRKVAVPLSSLKIHDQAPAAGSPLRTGADRERAQSGLLPPLKAVKIGNENLQRLHDQAQQQQAAARRKQQENNKRVGGVSTKLPKLKPRADKPIASIYSVAEAPPERIACHGCVLDVAWNGIGGGMQGQPEGSVKAEFYVASSLSTAAAAAFARGRKTSGGIVDEANSPTMDLFNGLIDGLTADLGTPARLTDFLNATHAASFQSSPGEAGGEWDLQILPPGVGKPLSSQLALIASRPAKVHVHDRRLRSANASTSTADPPRYRTLSPSDLSLGIPDSEASAQASYRETAGPRFYRPLDPVVLFCGLGKSYRWGNDGRLDPQARDRLQVRRSDQLLRSISVKPPGVPYVFPASVGPKDLLGSGPSLSALPPLVRALASEVTLIDPVNAPAMARTWMWRAQVEDSPNNQTRVTDAFIAETQLVLGLADPKANRAQILQALLYSGTPPSPLAITPWRAPFIPVFSETVYDFAGDEKLAPQLKLQGQSERSLLTDSLSAKFQSSSLKTVRDADGHEVSVLDIASRSLDVLSASLPKLDETLLAQGFTTRAGVLSIKQLRIIDLFGQARWLVKDGKVQPDVLGGSPKTTLPARLPYFSRLQFRFQSSSKPTAEAEPGQSPICGFLVPDFIEHGVEIFDSQGNGLGQLRHVRRNGAQQVEWEAHPWAKVVSDVAQDQPARVIENPDLLGLVSGVLTQPSDPTGSTALAALLRVIDTAQLAQKRQGSSNEHRPLLGKPVALARARLQLETTPSDLSPLATPPTALRPNPSNLTAHLGSVVQLDDGVLGYFVNGNYRLLRPVDPVVLQHALESGPGQGYQADPGTLPTGPITHPYVSQDATLSLAANQAMMISLLFDPKSAIYLTSEILPRKRLILDPELIADSLGKLAPTFAVGPVLLDPQRVSLPLGEVAEGTWIWRRKVGNSFPPATDVEAPSKDVGLGEQRVVIEEGWLGLR